MNHSQFGHIRYKAYAKKPGGYIIIDKDCDSLSIIANNRRYNFTKLLELDFLKEKLIPLKIEKELDDKYSSEMKYYAKYPIN